MTFSFSWISAGVPSAIFSPKLDHHDPVGNLHDSRHVVLHQQHRQAALAEARTISTACLVSSWFIPAKGSSSSKTFGIGGKADGDAKGAKMAMRKRYGKFSIKSSRAQKLKYLVGRTAECLPRPARASFVRERSREGWPRSEMMGDDNVVANPHILENSRLLKGAHNAFPGHDVGRKTGDALAPERTSPASAAGRKR